MILLSKNLPELAELCEAADSFHRRGYAFGATGNLSVRVGETVWVTPTGRPLCGLTSEDLALVDFSGATLNRNRPSKEAPFHLAIYRARAEARAVVHLHSTHAVALSCLADLDEQEPLPPLTPYYFMRVAPLAVIPYHRPGSPALAAAVERAAPAHNSLLLRHHGLICLGSSLSEAADRAEELEETARLYFLLRGERVRHLSAGDIEELRRVFGPQ